MEDKFNPAQFTIQQLIDNIESGQLGLPDLQRPFVWKHNKVRDLFDSLMRGFPIGYLMIWESRDFDKVKLITTDEKKKAYESPSQVIIDGQQRLTSLYAVFKGKKVINSKYQEDKIVISYNPVPKTNGQPYGRFEVWNASIERDKEWIPDISDMFAQTPYFFTNDYLKTYKQYKESKGQEIDNKTIEIITQNITDVYSLKNRIIPICLIKSDAEEEEVSEIFVRVNSSGVSLKENDFILTLLSLYWEDGRKMIESFAASSQKISDKPTAYNSLVVIDPQNIIRVLMAYAFNRARLKYAYKLLRGADFDKKGAINEQLREERFEIVKSKLPHVIDVNNWHEFIKTIKTAGYLSKEMILSNNNVFYVYTIYLIAKYRFNATYNQNMLLCAKWYYFCALVSLYTNSYESTMEQQLNVIKELTTFEELKEYIEGIISETLTDDYFNITLLGSKGLAVSGKSNPAWNAYCAALNILKHGVLFSKSNLLVSQLYGVGIDGNRKSLEKHHLFPKAYLKQLGYNDQLINQMANYAYIDWKDNMEILDEAPSIYYPQIIKDMSREDIIKMENENALPHGWHIMQYEDFLVERKKLMANIIRRGYEVLNK